MQSWQDLVRQEPRLQQYEEAGIQAAGNGWVGWYGWVRHFRDLEQLIPDGGRQVVLDHLKATFHGERLRLVQAARPQTAPLNRPTSPELRPERRRR